MTYTPISEQNIIIKKIQNVLSEKGWNVTAIRGIGVPSKDGLLNKPVERLLVEHDGQKTALAVKIQEQEPRLLFRRLYEEFGYAGEKELKDFDRFCGYLSMRDMPRREQSFYQNYNPELKPYIPISYGEVSAENKCCLLLEDLSYCKYMSQIHAPQKWGYEEIRLAIKTLAFFHSIELCQKDCIPQQDEDIDLSKTAEFLDALEIAMCKHSGMERFRETDQAAFTFIKGLEEYEKCFAQYGKKLIHNGRFFYKSVF